MIDNSETAAYIDTNPGLQSLRTLFFTNLTKYENYKVDIIRLKNLWCIQMGYQIN